MNGTSWAIAFGVVVLIAASILIAPHTSAEAPRARTLCASAKAAALEAVQASDQENFRRWQVEVKETCLAAVRT